MAKEKQKKKEQMPAKTRSKPVKGSLFEQLENWFEANSRKLFIYSCAATLLFSILHFNARVSEGGDDSTYIHAGYQYASDFFNYYFTYNAPFYPMFLSLPIKIFGINLVLLKFFSVVFNFFSLWFFYKAFEKRVPYLVLFPVIFFYAVNSYIQYFASQTYNEAFYLFFQSLFLFCFFRLWDKIKDTDSFSSLKQHWKLWLGAGLLLMVLSITKNVAVIIFPAVIVFFLFQKQWKNAVSALIVSAAVRGFYELVKSVIWGSVAQLSSQGSMLLQKDPYIKEKGMENFGGFVDRFLQNSEIYLSRRFFEIIGFSEEITKELTESQLQNHIKITILLSIIVLAGIFLVIRNKNKALLFASIFTGALVVATFIALQIRWAQPRLILVHMPALLLVIFYGFHALFKNKDVLNLLYLAIIAVFCGSNLISSYKKIEKNIPILSKNMKGDLYYGFTPDWVHFLKMSRWCADSLPENAVVVSRKAPMSFIYGRGKEFFSLNSVIFYDPKTKQSNPDSAMQFFKEKKIQYVIMASLRLNPRQKTQQVINTIHNILLPMTKNEKYKSKLKLVHQEGRDDDEPTYLYEILN